MDSQNTTNSINFTWKKETGGITFDQEGIRIPENLSPFIKGDISALITDNLIIKEDNFYIFKVGEKIKLKIIKKIRIKVHNQKYTITFGVGMGFFSRPILKFKNLTHEKYKRLLHILETNNIFSAEKLKEFEEFAEDRIYTLNTYRYAIWGCLSVFFLVSGLVFIELLYEYHRILFFLYFIIVALYLLYNLLFDLSNVVHLAFHPADFPSFDKRRKTHITQKIARNFFLMVITFVWIFAFTR